MTDLLPIIFARGQNEGIDPRVAPPDVHSVAQNVRWRKDGRPAKRYGVSAVTTVGLSALGYNSQRPNAIAAWNDTPVIAIGSTVRQLGALGWNAQVTQQAGDLAHFGPGERYVIARDESAQITYPSSGQSQGMVLTAWTLGNTDLYFAVNGRDGSTIVSPRLIVAGGIEPRVISTDNFIYILTKIGANLQLWTFDPTTLAITNAGSPGTLDAAGSHYDAIGRGADFAVFYQSGANQGTIKTFSGIAAPVQTAINAAVGITGSLARLGIGGTATSSVFVVWVEAGTGRVIYSAYSNAALAPQGFALLDTDANNARQPGIAIETNTVATFVWGGFIAATETSYVRTTRANNASVVLSPTGVSYNVALVSKPFFGPAFPTLGTVDGPYVWVSTSNDSTKWDTQRSYYLLKLVAASPGFPSRHMHVPSCPPDNQIFSLFDVIDLGSSFGFFVPVLNAFRFNNGGGLGVPSANGVDGVTALSIFASARSAARDTSIAGRALQFSGGSLFELNGTAEETDFSNFPVIQSFTRGGGGLLTSLGVYIYRAVYEWIDAQGRRHRSAPSDPVTVTMGAADTSVTLTLKPMIANSHADKGIGFFPPRGGAIHIYRTLAGGNTFHRVTPNVGAPAALINSPTTTYTDLMIDGIAALQEFIYTDGGVADNTLCPPHTFQALCNARLWVGGQLDRCVITASKLLVEGEPTQFSDLEQFSVFLPQKCTGLASLDGTIIAFAADRIYLVSGDGPDDQGAGSFSTPSELPTDVGCIDWRSVLETSIGIFFQARRGIYLLPRGFGAPVFVGAEIESTLTSYPIVVSASLVVIPSGGQDLLGEITARFVVSADEAMTASAVLVYDLRTGGWSVDEIGQGPNLAGVWPGKFITARSAAGLLTLQQESAAEAGYANASGAFISTAIGTGDIRPFGVAGYGGFDRVVVVGEFRGAARVTVQVSVDGDTPDFFVYTVTSADGPADGSVYLDVTPRTRMGSALRILCSDATTPGGPTEGFLMQALFIEYETIGKTKRLAQARKA